jgi:flavin-dependent dehydrogenase
MSGDDRIMIVGSGLGGLTAAVALQRRGKDVVLFEQFDKLLEVGAGITLNSNAITALREIGLDKTAEERGSVLEKFAHRSSDGKLITTWDTGSIGHNLHAPIVGISRPEIQRTLAESLGDVELRFGHKLVGLEQDGSGVTARFENGAEERGAVLIGADGGPRGLHSPPSRTSRQERIRSGTATAPSSARTPWVAARATGTRARRRPWESAIPTRRRNVSTFSATGTSPCRR